MASFDLAYEVLEKFEGGISNHPADRGGETRFGVTRTYWRRSGRDETAFDDLNATGAREVFWTDWWQEYRLGMIDDQRVATDLLLAMVNLGAGQAVRILQRALWIVGGDRGAALEDDGVLGPLTRGVLLDVTRTGDPGLLPIPLDAAFRGGLIAFYTGLVSSDPSQRVFLDGWINRALWDRSPAPR